MIQWTPIELNCDTRIYLASTHFVRIKLHIYQACPVYDNKRTKMQAILVAALILIAGYECVRVRHFLGDTSIFSKVNWLEHRRWKNCTGVIFTEDVELTFIDRVNTSKLILPINGKLYLSAEGSTIDFANDTDCIQLGSIRYRSWFLPSSWLPNWNSAVPNSEKIPCRYDKALFPALKNTAVKLDSGYSATAKYIMIGNRGLEAWEVDDMDYLYPFFTVANSGLGFYGKLKLSHDCYDEGTCVCHDEEEYAHICLYQSLFMQENIQCTNPLRSLIEGCHMDAMCGGRILFKSQMGFDFKKFRSFVLKNNINTDVHVSKVSDVTDLYQIIFSEENFTGTSQDAARDFYNLLISENIMNEYKITTLDLNLSGLPLIARNDNTVSIVFGTLFGVVVFFAAIFLVYVGPLKNYSITSRFTLKTVPLGVSRPFSVRYDNKSEEKLMFEQQSIAGSVLSLDKSFENPMYGQEDQSGPSTSSSTLNDGKWDSAHENPMFELKQTKKFDEEIVEDIK